MKAYISDGYTESGYIGAKPGHAPELSFTFRPMTVTEEAEYNHLAGKLSTEREKLRLAAKFITEHLINWSLCGLDGTMLQITQANVLSLKPVLFYRLWAIINGNQGSDLQPDADYKSPDLTEEELKMLDGIRDREGDDLKNS